MVANSTEAWAWLKTQAHCVLDTSELQAASLLRTADMRKFQRVEHAIRHVYRNPGVEQCQVFALKVGTFVFIGDNIVWNSSDKLLYEHRLHDWIHRVLARPQALLT